MLFGCGFGLLSAVWPLYLRDLGASAQDIGIVFGAGNLVAVVCFLPAGYLADRWNRKEAIGKTVVAWSGLTALGATALNFPMLVGFRSMLGFGQAITEPSAASLASEVSLRSSSVVKRCSRMGEYRCASRGHCGT